MSLNFEIKYKNIDYTVNMATPVTTSTLLGTLKFRFKYELNGYVNRKATSRGEEIANAIFKLTPFFSTAAVGPGKEGSDLITELLDTLDKCTDVNGFLSVVFNSTIYKKKDTTQKIIDNCLDSLIEVTTKESTSIFATFKSNLPQIVGQPLSIILLQNWLCNQTNSDNSFSMEISDASKK